MSTSPTASVPTAPSGDETAPNASVPTAPSGDETDERHLTDLIRKFVKSYDDPDIYREVLELSHYRLPIRKEPCTPEERNEIILRVRSDWYVNEAQWRRGQTEQQTITKCRTTRSFSGSYLYHDISTGQLLTYDEFETRYYSYLSDSRSQGFNDIGKVNEDSFEGDSSNESVSDDSLPVNESKATQKVPNVPILRSPKRNCRASYKRDHLSIKTHDDDFGYSSIDEKTLKTPRTQRENDDKIIIENHQPGETRVPFAECPESPVMIADFDEDMFTSPPSIMTKMEPPLAVTVTVPSCGSLPSPLKSISSPLKKQRV
jgi:hypothetical protein